MPETATKGKSRGPANRDEGTGDSSLPPLRVRYYRQMKPQRVYAVVVSWQKTERPPRGEGKEVTVRLIVAGAQVLPAEQTMDAAKPDAKAVFYVTPLAKGWLRNQKLEVLAQGRKVQEIPMASKVVSQRLTWFLLLLTFLVPWFISEFVKHSPMSEATYNAKGRVIYRDVAQEVKDYIKENVPHTPDFLKGTFVEKGLLETRSLVANSYQHLVQVSKVEPIAFYAGAILFSLTLISAFMRMQKRRKATGKPIPVAAVSKSVEVEE